ncbi:MAG TPA: helix-turn-helix transcriptional regulator, partial [Planctomycetota bacterium]|nr:helix-turn-helix transcriptional regulator [Planctomycetota bacterium]
KGYLSNIENGKRLPPSDHLIKKIAKVLNIPARDLLRLAHIDKIPKDIKAELKTSTIISSNNKKSKNIIVSSLIHKQEDNFPKGYLPVLKGNPFPSQFINLENLLKTTKEVVQFSIPGIKIDFALQICDNSMCNKENPLFQQDSIVLFRPIKKPFLGIPVFIIYKNLDKTCNSTFRIVKNITNTIITLHPINRQYKKEIHLVRKNIVGIWKAIACIQGIN